jgi:hypothetical protein
MDDASPRLARSAAAAAALIALSVLTGCGQSEPETRIIRGPEETTQTVLSPIARGELRTEVLKTARAAWDAYVAMDIEAMEPLFVPSLVEQRAELKAEYEREGREPRDLGEIDSFDVVSMSADGARSEVLIKLVAADGSTVDPAGTERKVNLVLERDETGGHLVTSVIAAAEILR